MAGPRRLGGFTLIEILVGLVAIAIVVALLVPAFGRVRRQERVVLCAAHLRTLHQASDSYYGKTVATRSTELGIPFWAALAKTTPPLVLPDTLRCPLNQEEGAPVIQYLGPAADPRLMVKDDPIGCDLDWNHSLSGKEGGNVLLRSGAVMNDNPSHPEGIWGTAHRIHCK